MNKLFPLLIAGGVLVGAAYLFKKGQGYTTLLPRLVGANVKFVGIKPVLQLKVSLQNQSSQELTINGFSGNVSLNGSHIGSVSTYGMITIPAMNEKIALLDCTINAVTIATEIAFIIDGSHKVAANFLFDGAALLGQITVPLKLSYKLI